MPAPVTGKAIVKAVAAQDRDQLAAALSRHEGPVPAQAMMNAGRLAWLPGLRLLVANGGDLNASFRNYRPLHALIQEQPHAGVHSTPARVACLKWMLEHGADAEQLGAWPQARALVVAAFCGDPAYVAALRDAGARIDVFTASALGDAPRVKKLLAKDSALATARDGGSLTALQCSAGSRMGAGKPRTAKGLLECARALIAAGADVNALTESWGHSVSVAYFAIRSGRIDLLTLLLDHGLDPTAAISTAAWEGRGDILDLLIARGADLTRASDGTRPVLNELVRWGQFSLARLYLSKGGSVHQPDDRGWTSMHQAVSRGNLKILEDLLAAGGDAKRADHDGRTPRGMAKKSGRADLLQAIDRAASKLL
jgi:ankyrin repeat protein